MMRYLSQEWKAAQWRAFEEEQIGDDMSDCGGQTTDSPPCGGCSRCMRMQFGYYLDVEERTARVLLRAGFDVAPPSLITLDYLSPYSLSSHDSWRCKSAGERDGYFFPWEKRS